MNDTYFKYPRTPHLPSSLGMTSDDKMASAETLAYLKSGIELTVSEKMDGGNISLYPNYFHARSLDGTSHAWDSPAKALHARIKHEIPQGWRITAESMYARRSVSYDQLEGPLYVFGIWDETNTLLSWDDMTAYAEMLSLPVVPLLYRGTDFKKAVSTWGEQKDDKTSEGFVLRDVGRIPYDDFAKHVAKYVRANHVQTSADWRSRDDFALNGFI
jgi:hypothetical protein